MKDNNKIYGKNHVNSEVLDLADTERCHDNFPNELDRLEKLLELNLSVNRLLKIPEPVLHLHSLKKLDLSHNELCDLSNLTDNWPCLEYFNLSHNKLTHLPTGITRLTSVRKLYLQNNQLTFGGIPYSIGKLANLEVFNASNNLLENIPEGLCRCGHMKRLVLNSNKLVALPDAIHYLIETLDQFEVENNPDLVLPPKPKELKKGAGLAYYNIDFSLESQLGQMIGQAKENHDPAKHAKDNAARLRRLRRRKAEGDSSTVVLEGMRRVTKDKAMLLQRREQQLAEEREQEARHVAARKWQDALSRPALDYGRIFDPGAGLSDGLEMWEIDEFYPRRCEDDTLQGRLLDGDCYILLETNLDGPDDTINTSSEPHNDHQWTIYYWIGARASLDKRACAAMHAVNLRNLLGVESRIHREEQDEESEAFLDLFGGRIMTLEGCRGETGFLNVEEKEVIVKMYRLFGKDRDMHIVSMPVSPACLDPKFVYVLDGSSRIYLWIGSESRLMMQTKGRLMAEKIINKERKGEATIYMEHQGHESHEFWCVVRNLWKPPPLPTGNGTLEAIVLSKANDQRKPSAKSQNQQSMTPDEALEAAAKERAEQQRKILDSHPPLPPASEVQPAVVSDHVPNDWKLPKPLLYDVKLGKGYLEMPQVDLVGTNGLKKELLKAHNVYLLDSGGELFVWMGDKAPKFLRYAGCKLAQELTQLMPRGCFGGADSAIVEAVERQDEDMDTRPPPQICVQGAESQIFKAQFPGWESAMAVDFTRTADSVARRGADIRVIMERDRMKVDLRALLAPREQPLPWQEALSLLADWNEELCSGAVELPTLEQLQSTTAAESSANGRSIQQFIMVGKKWIPVEPQWFGHFFSKDSYIVIARSWEFDDDVEYSDTDSRKGPQGSTDGSPSSAQDNGGEDDQYDDNLETRTKTDVYFWQGREASDLSWVTFNLSVRSDMEKRLSHNADDPSQPLAVSFKHVHQQQEEFVFLAYFQRQMILHRGHYKDRDSKARKEAVQFYHYRANGNPICSRLVEVTPNSMTLNSKFTYILKVPKEKVNEWSVGRKPVDSDIVFLWLGNLAEESEEGIMEHISGRLYDKSEIDFRVISEGGEDDIFWRSLNGRRNYDRAADYMTRVRLFRLSNEQGYFSASEKCADFCQDDLADDHVMLLDTGQQVYVWLGKRTSDVEVKLSLQAARLYKDNCARVQPGNPRQLKLIAKGAEPHSFKRCFHGWGPFREPKDWSG